MADRLAGVPHRMRSACAAGDADVRGPSFGAWQAALSPSPWRSTVQAAPVTWRRGRISRRTRCVLLIEDGAEAELNDWAAAQEAAGVRGDDRPVAGRALHGRSCSRSAGPRRTEPASGPGHAQRTRPLPRRCRSRRTRQGPQLAHSTCRRGMPIVTVRSFAGRLSSMVEPPGTATMSMGVPAIRPCQLRCSSRHCCTR